jgi:anti-sigma regulatory factor (Ser/Thr protein kinase)
VCRSHQTRLAASPTAPRSAREFAQRALHAWEVQDAEGAVALVVSELVTNSVLHARTETEIALHVAAGKIEVAVRDHDPRPPVTRAARQDLIADLDSVALGDSSADADPRAHELQVGPAGSVLAGRGMLLIDALSDEWGVSELADGKVVWSHIAIPREWPHLHACPCPAGESRVRLASGDPVVPVPGPWDEALAG